MIETASLILDKAKFSDWKDMYNHVWSQEESARYMLWNVTTNEEDAKVRMNKTIEFQKNHDTYVVYEKSSGKAIGFAGVEKMKSHVYQETGICLGPDYTRKGYGKQIVKGLIQYCRNTYGAKEFIYSTRKENKASNQLANAMGFKLVSSESKTDNRDGHMYYLLTYRYTL